MHRRIALAAACLVAISAAPASAGPPGRWTQITRFPNSTFNVGLARTRDRVLHVLWAGPNRQPATAIFDTQISPGGKVGSPATVLSGWNGVKPPTAATAPDGSVNAVISGSRSGLTSDPFSGLNRAIGPGTWTLGPRAFGNGPGVGASNADVRSAFLPNGQLVSVWASAAKLFFEIGTDPNAAPTNITPQGLLGNPSVVVDQKSGAAVIAYQGAGGLDYFRQILPTLGSEQAMANSKAGTPMIAARAGGGVYSAYTPDFKKVLLLRFGGASKRVPIPSDATGSAGIAPGPGGRLWIYAGNAEKLYVTRTNKAVTRFERYRSIRLPKGAVANLRMEGEGSAGPLDLFADLTINGTTKDGAYHQQVRPRLSLSVSTKRAKKGFKLTVRVTDAGDPVAGAKVKGLPGGSKRTDASGAVKVRVNGGRFRLRAGKPGYVGARRKLSR